MSNTNGNAVWTRWVIGLLASIALFFGGFIVRAQTSVGPENEKRIELLEAYIGQQREYNISVATQLGAQSARYDAIMEQLRELKDEIRDAKIR